MSEKADFIRRCATWTAIIHTMFVVIAVSLKHALWGTSIIWWHADRSLRLIDLPVRWLVDPTLQRVPPLPPEMVFNRLGLAAGVNEVLAYGIFGGLFYAGLAAVVAAFIQRNRMKTVVIAEK